MSIEKAQIAVPINGRDAGKRFIVIETENEYSFLVDGKGRRVEKPKRKKNKHVKVEGKLSGPIAEKLIVGERVTNSEIRRVLSTPAESGAKGGM
ncbi:MAG: KOW domain-containing RNA-binding protein [Oscillospiraceae bacterium]|nr:KOW domain-containing RNA-binding protein [Oscillospiraceae bacterium]